MFFLRLLNLKKRKIYICNFKESFSLVFMVFVGINFRVKSKH